LLVVSLLLSAVFVTILPETGGGNAVHPQT